LKNCDFVDLPLRLKGKVRNVYDAGERLVMVTTDRISAFDVVFDTVIPDKGKVLTGISEFWFDMTRDIVANHLVSTRIEDMPQALHPYKSELSGRTMWVEKMKMIDVECIVEAIWKVRHSKSTIKAVRFAGLRSGKV
jgi:phosphoribosylaminoimidazole-succinocarboxamide synthase